MTLTFYNLPRILSGAEFSSRDQDHFQMQLWYMVWKYTLFGYTFEQKNWKPEHANAPIVIALTMARIIRAIPSVFHLGSNCASCCPLV